MSSGFETIECDDIETLASSDSEERRSLGPSAQSANDRTAAPHTPTLSETESQQRARLVSTFGQSIGRMFDSRQSLMKHFIKEAEDHRSRTMPAVEGIMSDSDDEETKRNCNVPPSLARQYVTDNDIQVRTEQAIRMLMDFHQSNATADAINYTAKKLVDDAASQHMCDMQEARIRDEDESYDWIVRMGKVIPGDRRTQSYQKRIVPLPFRSGAGPVAIGHGAVAIGSDAVAVGRNARATGSQATAVGDNSEAVGDNACDFRGILDDDIADSNP